MPYFKKCDHHAVAGVGDWCLACVNAGKNKPADMGGLKQRTKKEKAEYMRKWASIPENKEKRKKTQHETYLKRCDVERGKFVVYSIDTKQWKRVRNGPKYRWAEFSLASIYQTRKRAELAARQSNGNCVAMKQMETEAETLGQIKATK